MRVQNKQHFKDLFQAVLAAQAEAGYQSYTVMADGGCLCLECTRQNLGLIIRTTFNDGAADNPQWSVLGIDQHWEGEPVVCDNCYTRIEPTYGDD